jgi:photosystem II stability/assembly factor-like uncharacterized protein
MTRGPVALVGRLTGGRRSTALAACAACAAIAVSVSAHAQQQAVLFSDDFEHGAASWQLDHGWDIAAEGSNHVLSGTGHIWATLIRGTELGTITRFEHRFKLLGTSEVHINYRLNLEKTGRYWIGVQEGRLALVKMTPVTNPQPGQDPFVVEGLANVSAPVVLGTWHSLAITGQGNHLEVFLDGSLFISVTDDDNPRLSGTVAFECSDDASLMVDDVLLSGQPPSGPTWVATGGPRGGIGYDVRIDPRDARRMWVTDAYAGVYWSSDGGRTWQPRNEGITARSGTSGDGIPIFSLNLDPSNPDSLWAGTQGMRGVFKSTNGGANWVEMDQGIATQPSMEMRSFTVDPHDSNIAYCGGNYLAEAATLRQRGFIYKTTDGGTSWRLVHEPGALVRWIIIDPTDTRVIYAATGIFDRFAIKAEGVLKSVDGGATWRNINTGLVSLAVGALVMHPTNPQVLIAGCGKGSATFQDNPNDLLGGVFKTTNGGAQWRKVDPFSAGQEAQASAIAFAPSDPLIVYGDDGHNFMRSIDGGETWDWFRADAQGENRGNPISLAVHPTDPDTIFMNAYGGGVFVSTDGGRVWADSSRGVTGAGVWGIAADPSRPMRIVAASKNGIYLTEDAGVAWHGRSADGIDNMTAVAVDPTSTDVWLAGRQIDGHLWRTTDSGVTWQTVLSPLGEDTMTGGRRSIHQIAFAPSLPSVVYAATGIAPGYVATDVVGPGVYVSSSGGVRWEPRNQGLEQTRKNVLAVAVDRRNHKVVYIGLLGDGVFKSTDGGTSWSPARSGLLATEIRSLAIDPIKPDTVLAGAERGGVWRTVDGGTSWKQASNGMPPEASIHAIAVDVTHAGVVYAGDLTSGVYRSTDSGATWTAINNGLRNRAVNALSLTPDGLHLYAATEGNGVYRLDLPEVHTPRRRLRGT